MKNKSVSKILSQISIELKLLESFEGELGPKEKPIHFRLAIKKAVSTWMFVLGLLTDGPYDNNIEENLTKQFDKLHDTLQTLLLEIRKVVNEKMSL